MLWTVVLEKTLCDPVDCSMQASLSITNSRSLPKFISSESDMPSNHLILCHPLLVPPSIIPSIRVFSNEQFFPSGGQNIRVSASASVLPMNIQDWFLLRWTGWLSLLKRPHSSTWMLPVGWIRALVRIRQAGHRQVPCDQILCRWQGWLEIWWHTGNDLEGTVGKSEICFLGPGQGEGQPARAEASKDFCTEVNLGHHKA